MRSYLRFAHHYPLSTAAMSGSQHCKSDHPVWPWEKASYCIQARASTCGPSVQQSVSLTSRALMSVIDVVQAYKVKTNITNAEKAFVVIP